MYNQGQHAIVFMEVLSMNEALKTQLKILKLSDIKPNFSELSKSIMTDMKAKLLTEINQANWINIMISSNRNFLSEVRMSALCMSSFFLRGIQISVPTQILINTSNPKGLSR